MRGQRGSLYERGAEPFLRGMQGSGVPHGRVSRNTLRRSNRHFMGRTPRGRYSHRYRPPIIGWLFFQRYRHRTWFFMIILFVVISSSVFALGIFNPILYGPWNKELDGTRTLSPNEYVSDYRHLYNGHTIRYSFSERYGKLVHFLILDSDNAHARSIGSSYSVEREIIASSGEGKFRVPYNDDWLIFFINPAGQGDIRLDFSLRFEVTSYIVEILPVLVFGAGILFIIITVVFSLLRSSRHTEEISPSTPPSSSQDISEPSTPNGDPSDMGVSSRERDPIFIYPQKPRYVEKASNTCYYCGESLDFSEDKFCSECGHGVKHCQVCHSVIGYDEKTAACPECSHEFHEGHIREWLKVSGDCPICKTRLNEENLIYPLKSSVKSTQEAHA